MAPSPELSDPCQPPEFPSNWCVPSKASQHYTSKHGPVLERAQHKAVKTEEAQSPGLEFKMTTMTTPLI